jgi:hypothetical protein
VLKQRRGLKYFSNHQQSKFISWIWHRDATVLPGTCEQSRLYRKVVVLEQHPTCHEDVVDMQVHDAASCAIMAVEMPVTSSPEPNREKPHVVENRSEARPLGCVDEEVQITHAL